MKIVAYEDRVDLRTVKSKTRYLNRIARALGLRNGEAICFTNKALTRFRLIFKYNNVVFLCIPEVDEKRNLSIYLRVSEHLAALAGLKDVRVEFDLLAVHTKSRIVRRKGRKHKKPARKKTAARKKKRGAVRKKKS
jgi:hypothetical protein